MKLESGAFRTNTKKIRAYLCYAIKNGLLSPIPREATNITVSKLSKFGMAAHDTYVFSLSYLYERRKQTLELISKLYGMKKRKCQEESQILKALEHVNFPVPHVYIQEIDKKHLGSAFIIMKKVEGETIKDYVKHYGKEEAFKIIKRFAETLAFLHNLRWEELGLDFLRTPKDEYDYAKKQARWKEELLGYVKERESALTGFAWATNWLKLNAPKCPCDRYSLLHGDMNPKNFLVTRTGRIIALDWEYAEVGDALKDVGYAYHDLMHMFGVRNIDKKGAEIAAYFIRQYIESSNRKIDPFALRFYIFSAGLREAIYLRNRSEKAVHPTFTFRTFGPRYLPLFLFVSWHYRSRYKKLEHFLRSEAMDYEQKMFGTPGGKVLSSIEIKNVLRFLSAEPSELILDVGTGSGRIAREIVSKTKAIVIGIDAERPAIESAKKRGKGLSECEMVIADGQYMPFKDCSFAGIICIRALKYFPNYTLGISEMVRILKAGKSLVLELPSALGYEAILQHLTSIKGKSKSRVFNPYRMKSLLKSQKLSVVDSVPLEKIPLKIWNSSTNLTILRLLLACENILRKIPPSILSKSVLFKCIKEKKTTSERER